MSHEEDLPPRTEIARLATLQKLASKTVRHVTWLLGIAVTKTGYLAEMGWFASLKKNQPIDSHGNALPWMSYPFIDFIGPRLTGDLSVFEWGAGASTLWFAQRVKKVTSAEHNEQWYREVLSKKPTNVRLILAPLNHDYPRIAASLNEKFDIVVIDGRCRPRCCRNALPALKDSAVIILDDSQSTKYEEAVGFLLANGFKQLDFCGISPASIDKKCTSVFYRENNALGI